MNVALTERPANAELARRSRQYVVQPRALSKLERDVVVEILQSEEYCDQPRAGVHPSLLVKSQHLCSVGTMHRILRSEQAAGVRRNQRPVQHNAISSSLHATSVQWYQNRNTGSTT
jgi:hypothetical protein